MRRDVLADSCAVSRSIRAYTVAACAVVVLSLCAAAPVYAHHLQKAATTTLPITTSSAKARQLYYKGREDFENLYLERCNDDWRVAVKEDANLAVAWAWIAFNSTNPE